MKRLFDNCRGTIAVKFALTFPVLLMLIGGSIDYAAVLSQRTLLQSAADAASTAAAKGLSLADVRQENVESVVNAVFHAYLTQNNDANAGNGAYTIETRLSYSPMEVDVRVQQPAKTYFGSSFGLGVDNVGVRSLARVVGKPNICVLGLEPSEARTIFLERNARVTGQNCAVFSNSTSTVSIVALQNAMLSASVTCSAGGIEGTKANFDPEPYTDCPTFEDPLADRPEPQAETCKAASPPRIIAHSTTLEPGTYCGGITIRGSAVVTLDPGVYVMNSGPLIVQNGGSLIGKDVGFYFTGTRAGLKFDASSTISLEAPKEGIMAGILMFESRSQPTTSRFDILSNDARTLLGTIYLPRGWVHVETNNPVADRSAYTAIVARKLTLGGAPHLVLNTDYGWTEVPVPEGIKGAGQPVALRR